MPIDPRLAARLGARTPADVNTLSAAAAAFPAVAARIMGGTEADQSGYPPPSGMRMATPADVGAPDLRGITLDDIQRMVSSPARYGPIYTRGAPSTQPAAPKPAVDNAKRTRTKVGPDRRPTKPGGTTTPTKPEPDQPLPSVSPWWLLLGALKKRPGEVGKPGKDEYQGPTRSKGALTVVEPTAENIIDAIWTDPQYLPPGQKLKQVTGPLGGIGGPERPPLLPAPSPASPPDNPAGTGAEAIAQPPPPAQTTKPKVEKPPKSTDDIIREALEKIVKEADKIKKKQGGGKAQIPQDKTVKPKVKRRPKVKV